MYNEQKASIRSGKENNRKSPLMEGENKIILYIK